MKFRKTLAAVALAASTASSSCHWEFVNREAGRQYSTFINEKKKRIFFRQNSFIKKEKLPIPTPKVDPPSRFPCEEGLVLPGGKDSRIFIFLQHHRDLFNGEINVNSANSQLLIFRVLQHLAKFGLNTVILEGVFHSDSFQPLKEQNKGVTHKRYFEKCMNTIHAMTKKAGSFRQSEIEDICLMNFYAEHHDNSPIVLLSMQNPAMMKVTGFERNEKETTEFEKDLKPLQEEMRRRKTIPASHPIQSDQKEDEEEKPNPNLLGIKRILESKNPQEASNSLEYIIETIFGFEFAPHLEIHRFRSFLDSLEKHNPEIKKNRSFLDMLFAFYRKHGHYVNDIRSRYAVESAISYSSWNTALVIGADHQHTLAIDLMKIPHKSRPTVHFLEFECTNKDSFVTSNPRMLEIVNALIGKQDGKPPK